MIDISPPWLRIARVAAPIVVGLMLVGMLLWTRSMLASTRVQRDAAVTEVVEFRRLATDATVPPGAAGTRPLLSSVDAKAALVGAFRDRDDARAALTRIDRDTKAARVRAAGDDVALARAQAANAASLARAQPRIDELAAAVTTGSAAADAKAIDEDSRAAWEAWR